jgi:hypothetical protein
MISTGDTAFVLKQHKARSASASGPSAPSPRTPVLAHHHPFVAAPPTFALATACAHGPKG